MPPRPRLGRCVALAACAGSLGCGGAKPQRQAAPTVTAAPRTRVTVEDGDSDDGVQLVTGKGHVEPAAVDAAIARHKAALSSCYTEKVGKRAWLGGHLALRWEVDADGTVAQVLLADSDLGAWPVEKCVLEAARMATFGKPIGGAAEINVPLEFSARGRPAVWDDEQSAKAVGGQLGKLDACARGKIVMPRNVQITLYVGPHGRAQSVGFASATSALDDTWATCAEKAALAWRLPDPKGQVTKLAVRYRPR